MAKKIFEAEVIVYLTYISEEPAEHATLAKYASEKIKNGDWYGHCKPIDLDPKNLSHETLNTPVMGYEGREEWLVSDWLDCLN